MSIYTFEFFIDGDRTKTVVDAGVFGGTRAEAVRAAERYAEAGGLAIPTCPECSATICEGEKFCSRRCELDDEPNEDAEIGIALGQDRFEAVFRRATDLAEELCGFKGAAVMVHAEPGGGYKATTGSHRNHYAWAMGKTVLEAVTKLAERIEREIAKGVEDDDACDAEHAAAQASEATQ